MHVIHVLPFLSAVTGSTGGKDPVSIKKLQKGGAHWSSEKDIFCFLMGGKAKTFSNPKIKSEEIVAYIQIILENNQVPPKQYCRIIRKIRHVAIILYDMKGLLLPIKKALKR